MPRLPDCCPTNATLPLLALSIVTIVAACHPLGDRALGGPRDRGREQRTLAGAAPALDASVSRDAAPCSADRCVVQPVRFSEITYDPEGVDGAGEREFIELIASPNAPLWGYTVEVLDGPTGRTIAAVTLLDAANEDGLFVIGGSAISAARAYFTAPLPNGYDLARIYGCDGSVVDELRWGSWPDGSQHGAASAQSLARCDAATTGWSTAAPSPGSPNHGHFTSGPCVDAPETRNPPSASDAATDTSPALSDRGDTAYGETTEHGDDRCDPSLLGGLRLNEVLPDPIGTDTATTEFAELRVTASTIPLSFVLALWDGATASIVAREIVVVEPGPERLLVVGSDVPGALALRFALQNGPDALLVLDCNDAIIDGVAWGVGSATVADAIGVSDVGPLEPGRAAARCGAEGDFRAALPSPGDENTGFLDEAACPLGCDEVSPSWVVINEVLFDPPGRDGAGEFEFIELRGPPGEEMTGWRLVGVDGSRDTTWLGPIPIAGTFDDAGLLVLGGSSVPGALPLPGLLQNGPDAVVLQRCGGGVGDSVAWGIWARPSAGEGVSAWTPREGSSLCRNADSVDTGDNMRDFASCSTPSPGRLNEWDL